MLPNHEITVAEQREVLLTEYLTCLQRYIIAVEDLELISPCLDAKVYEKCWNEVEACRLKCQKARVALQRHPVVKHGHQ
jgi:hypothetical protein